MSRGIANWELVEQQRNESPRLQLRTDEIEKGKSYIYRGKLTMTPHGTYNATVIDITKHLVVLSLKIKQHSSQMIDAILGEPDSYTWAVCKQDIGKTERFFKEE